MDYKASDVKIEEILFYRIDYIHKYMHGYTLYNIKYKTYKI